MGKKESNPPPPLNSKPPPPPPPVVDDKHNKIIELYRLWNEVDGIESNLKGLSTQDQVEKLKEMSSRAYRLEEYFQQ